MLPHQFEIALESAGGEDDRLRTEFICQAAAKADTPHSPDLSALDDQ